MNRADFQQLADVRIAEAALLLAAGAWDGAYYLAGYSVECALKACIAKLTQQYDFPSRQAQNLYTHRITDLVVPADLRSKRDADSRADSLLSGNWWTVEQWREDSRYERNAQATAEALYTAITDPQHGVLQWIKLHW